MPGPVITPGSVQRNSLASRGFGLRRDGGGAADSAFRGRAQDELRAPPEDVLSGPRPFGAIETVDLGRRQAAVEGFAETRESAGATNEGACFGPRGLRQAPHGLGREERSLTEELPWEGPELCLWDASPGRTAWPVQAFLRPGK